MSVKMAAHVEKVEGLTVRSLFQWEPGESDILSHLILALKGPHRARAWRHWALQFARHHEGRLPSGSWQVLSAPSSKKTKDRDHADAWGEGLADLHGLRFEGKLFGRPGGSHRFLNRDRRMKEHGLVKLTESPVNRHRAWIMADDILTTGATAQAVYRALQRPKHFEIWCLARRTHISCAASGSMLRLGELKGFQI
ncbi:MAG: phosphoribosyltransferase [Bdellovibrionaceae bacterium]|nr:phosphoribosyltransferase [Pseudobdellovibrionaceae bacterium]